MVHLPWKGMKLGLRKALPSKKQDLNTDQRAQSCAVWRQSWCTAQLHTPSLLCFVLLNYQDKHHPRQQISVKQLKTLSSQVAFFLILVWTPRFDCSLSSPEALTIEPIHMIIPFRDWSTDDSELQSLSNWFVKLTKTNSEMQLCPKQEVTDELLTVFPIFFFFF